MDYSALDVPVKFIEIGDIIDFEVFNIEDLIVVDETEDLFSVEVGTETDVCPEIDGLGPTNVRSEAAESDPSHRPSISDGRSKEAEIGSKNLDLGLSLMPGGSDDGDLDAALFAAATGDEQRNLLKEKLSHPSLTSTGKRTKRKNRPVAPKVTDINRMEEMVKAFQQVYYDCKSKREREKQRKLRWKLAVDSLRQVLPNITDNSTESDVIAQAARTVASLRQRATSDMMKKFYSENANF